MFITKEVNADVEKAATFFDNLLDRIKSALPTLIFAVIVFIIGIVAVKIITKIISRFMKKSTVDNAAVAFLVSFIRVVLYTIVIVSALTLVGVPMSSIIALIGAAGLAVSLALQNYLSNLAGGFIILFSKPFKSGDMIEIDSTTGQIKSINILYTKMLTSDNKTVLIPNGKVADAKIINYSEMPTRRLDMTFDISYSNDFEKAKEIIQGITDRNKLVHKEPAPLIRLGAHKESALEIVVKLWVANDKYYELFYDMSEAVKREFDKHGIEIPYNQLDVHIQK
ncbi:MAG: mechanosensitive ion channel [Ruminococcus sp.]|nr:mechanosensitive ion channel [Ruminococcus sp.]